MYPSLRRKSQPVSWFLKTPKLVELLPAVNFPEKLEYLVLDKAEMAREYQGEFIQAVVSSNPQIRQFVESMYQREINQRLLDFFEEGKRQGYVNPEISQD